MKVLHMYEVTMLDGARYRGEIAYKDSEKIVLRMRQRAPEQKVRIFSTGISSIRELGWQRAYALR